MNTALTRANAMQKRAASPRKSVFVSANAGSGKTRVLVERVSRILLSGTLPDKILCLTYTKAAAAEMQTRLFSALGKWSIMNAKELTQSLNKLQNRNELRSEKELGRARRLFARALETPGGLKVQTIHAFCERLLKRFPLEAGILPGTDAIDEKDMRALQEQSWRRLETQAVQNPKSDIARAITLLAAQKGDAEIENLYAWMMSGAYKIDGWKEAGGINTLAKHLGIPADITAETAMVSAWRAAPKQKIKMAAQGMRDGGKTDQTKAGYLSSALSAQSPVDAYRHYEQMFFTKAGHPNASMVTGKAGEMALSLFGNKASGPQDEALRMLGANETVRCAHVLELTGAVYTIALAAAKEYRALKSYNRAMDFDDQIYLARRVLKDAEASDWVRYKLDGGVDHILVDEAQDTSAAQWDIINALADPFFQPSPDENPRTPRTLFAVGDEKQSIYSFQGAEPELFLKNIQALIKKQNNTPDVNMSMSFRSSAQILDLVDEIFYAQGGITETFDADKFPVASDVGEHVANRKDVGLIEFWPAAKAPETADLETPWKPVPVNALSAHSAREQLARQIAAQIKTWLQNQELVFDRDLKRTRPMLARDIMILVTKRTDFFDAVIRNLKNQGVPVAGADRLHLTSSIAVQDLLSLAKFTVLPSDDLSLAEVLKSPMFSWSEDRLFAAAHARKGSLWDAVPDGEDREVLCLLKSMAEKFAPYEFFARTLALVTSSGGASFMQKFYDRLGLEAGDAIDVFLARALAHQRTGAPSLTRFIYEIARGENIIKREMDSAQNEVRVMTVHAAKGLEAPVVILPDTTQIKTAGRESVYSDGVSGFALRMRGAQQPHALSEMQKKKQDSMTRESMRLLYVALTRAESRLLICGFESNKKVAEGSWHDRVERALQAMNTKSIDTEFGAGLQYGQKAKKENHKLALKSKPKHEPLPEWARALSRATPVRARSLSPSKLVARGEGARFDVPVRSPHLSGPARPDTFQRGNIIHKLLQILPELETSTRRAATQKYLRKQSGLLQNVATQIENEVFAVLEHEEFAAFFAPGSMAEVSLAGRAKGLPEDMVLNGQIDRLCVLDNDVWIVDYKSNRPPPRSEENIAPLYIRQMAAYRALSREIFPNKKVHTALLWTDGPRLMPLSDAILDRVNWDDVLPS